MPLQKVDVLLQRWEPIVYDLFPANITFWIKLDGISVHHLTKESYHYWQGPGQFNWLGRRTMESPSGSKWSYASRNETTHKTAKGLGQISQPSL